LLSIRCILASRVTLDQPPESLVSLLDVFRRAFVCVLAKPALEDSGIIVEIRQTLDVEGVVNARVNRILAYERVRRLYGEFRGAALVIGVHEVELNLARDVAERIAGLDRLEYRDAAPVVAVLNRRLCLVISVLQVLNCVVRLFIAGTGRQHGENREQNCLTGPPLQARKELRRVEEVDHVYASRTKSASIP
jgi:hypothetical protein